MDLKEAQQFLEVVAERKAHNRNMESWRAVNPDPPPPANPLEAEIAYVLATNPRAVAPINVAATHGMPVLPLDGSGEPLDVTPTGDLATLCAWWRLGGPYETRWGGVLCGPKTGLYGLALDATGWSWLKELATERTLSRAERVLDWIEARKNPDRAALLGVPPVPNSWDSAPDQPSTYTRTHDGEPMWLREELAPVGALNIGYRGDRQEREAVAALRAAHRPPTMWQFLVWQYEPGLPVGRPLRDGVYAMAAIPLRDALIVRDETLYRIANAPAFSPTLRPPADWLQAVLREL